MFGKKKRPEGEKTEIHGIASRLDRGESVVLWVRQSRIKPGGAAIINPNSLYCTEKRIIIRNPVRMGLGGHSGECFYHQITNMRPEKGTFPASLIFYIPGMTEIPKSDRGMLVWGRESHGTMDAIPKKTAEEMYDYIRERLDEAKKAAGEPPGERPRAAEDPLAVLRMRPVKGEITKGEVDGLKKAVGGQGTRRARMCRACPRLIGILAWMP